MPNQFIDLSLRVEPKYGNPYKKRRKGVSRSWKAPEHVSMSKDMRRDKSGNLILDNRPTIMVPVRQPVML